MYIQFHLCMTDKDVGPAQVHGRQCLTLGTSVLCLCVIKVSNPAQKLGKGSIITRGFPPQKRKPEINTAHTPDLWPTAKTKIGQREGEMGGRGWGWREKAEEPTMVGSTMSWHLCCHVMDFKDTICGFYHIYFKLLHNVKSNKQAQTRYLSVKASVLTAALSGSTPPWLFHLHFLWILQLQGLQLLNNTGATADTKPL